jgi:hypothetical protein
MPSNSFTSSSSPNSLRSAARKGDRRGRDAQRGAQKKRARLAGSLSLRGLGRTAAQRAGSYLLLMAAPIGSETPVAWFVTVPLG